MPGFAGMTDLDMASVVILEVFSGTLGGNATLIGASANVVGAGICSAHGKPVTFVTFARYGVPLATCQLAFSALYVFLLFRVLAP